jgi:hypothetical protein
MTSQKSVLSQVASVYSQVLKYVKKYPLLITPFFIFTILELLSIVILFLAPRMPFRLLLAPLIRAFWGERFLHYPINFILLPKLTSLSRMVLSVLIGSFLTGMAVFFFGRIAEKREPRLKDAVRDSFKKYSALFLIVFAYVGIYYFLNKSIFILLAKYFIAGHRRLLFLGSNIWMGVGLQVINFILAIIIQSAFTYAVPALIIGKERLVKAIGTSFVIFSKNFLLTAVLVGLPMLLYVPIIIFELNASFLMLKIFPEVMLWVLFLGAVISSLVIDLLITLASAEIYIHKK